MVSSEVQRTLVKSPPELWAEISDPESLARHFGEFGEVHITRVQPEQKVEWEATDASGSVVIKPSGWGTKVKLTVERELAGLAAPAVEGAEGPEDAVPVSVQKPDPQAVEPEPQAVEPEPQAMEPDPQALEPEPQAVEPPEPPSVDAPESDPPPLPRRGFFARLFGWRRQEPTIAPLPGSVLANPEQEPLERSAQEAGGELRQALGVGAELEAERSALDEAGAEQPIAEERLERQPAQAPADEELAAGLQAAEAAAAEEVTAVLTGVLDRLGAAHHRPFSRA